MKLSNKIVCIITLSTSLSIAAAAADCGAPPLDKINLPSASSVTANTLKEVRNKLVAFSDKVDAYMGCMDQRGSKLLPYLTKEQQARWEEDITAVHETRRQLQISLNELIRTYRKQTASQ